MRRTSFAVRLGIGLSGAALALLLLGWATLGQAQAGGDRPPLGATDLAYTIRPGDTLDALGAWYDVDVACLFSLNNLPRSALLLVGDQIMISPSCPPYTGGALVVNPRVFETVEPNGDRLIIIRPGDTLSVLAQTYDVAIERILTANQIGLDSFLRPGDWLRIPAGGPPYGFTPPLTGDMNALTAGAGGGTAAYIVQYGDTLDQIASFFDLELACLLNANGLTAASVVAPGFVLALPGDCPPYDGLTRASERDLGGLALLNLTATPAPLDAAAQAAPPVLVDAAAAPTAISLPPLEGSLLPLDMTPMPDFMATATALAVPTATPTPDLAATATAFALTPPPTVALTMGPTRTPTPAGP